MSINRWSFEHVRADDIFNSFTAAYNVPFKFWDNLLPRKSTAVRQAPHHLLTKVILEIVNLVSFLFLLISFSKVHRPFCTMPSVYYTVLFCRSSELRQSAMQTWLRL